jgi:hypothetical protein
MKILPPFLENASKAQRMLQDHILALKKVPLQNPIRKLLLATTAAAAIYTNPSAQAVSFQAQPENAPTQSVQRTNQEGHSKSLKTSLLADRIHEAFIAEHILTGDFNEKPKIYMPIPGYVPPSLQLNDTRIGSNGRLEQNILQPANRIAPSLIQKLTGQYSSNILKTLGQTAKEQSHQWPKNRDALSQDIKTIWEQMNKQQTTPFQQLSNIEQEKYRRIADGLMYVTTLEKHLDRMDHILQTTQKEAAKGQIPSPQILAERLLQIQKSQKMLKGTPLESIPQQTWEIVASQTPQKTLADATKLLHFHQTKTPTL